MECVWSDSSEKQRKPSTLEGSTGFSLTSCVSLEQVNTGKVYRVNNIGHLSSVCSVLRITCWYMAESRGARKTYWWGAKRMGLEEGECASAEKRAGPWHVPCISRSLSSKLRRGWTPCLHLWAVIPGGDISCPAPTMFWNTRNHTMTKKEKKKEKQVLHMVCQSEETQPRLAQTPSTHNPSLTELTKRNILGFPRHTQTISALSQIRGL